ncbi:hypothetical protein [Succinimonas amylolytica]|uniref:hypothetical protein n=1 Tax=Succinimonas amylolytica TaxID=83769 RepID=UPI00037E723B|nr:hypothetical protein [Succinimonas amylolytica]
MSKFIEEFILGFMAVIFWVGVALIVKTVEPVGKHTKEPSESELSARKAAGQKFANWGRNYAQFPEHFKEQPLKTLKAVGIEAGKNPIGSAIKGTAAPFYWAFQPMIRGFKGKAPKPNGTDTMWNRTYGTAATAALLYGLGAGSTAGINNYALADYNNTAGVDMDQLAKYGQAIDMHKPVNGVRVDPAAFNEKVVQNQQGIPMVYRFPLGNTEDALKSAWDWVEYVEPRANQYAQYREAVKNLVAPGWGQGREGKWPIGDYYEDNPKLPQHINDAKKLYKYTRDIASLAENGDPTSREIISLLKSGKEVTPDQRDYLTAFMQHIAKQNDFNDDKSVITSAFNSKGANYWLQANGITPIVTNPSNAGLGNGDNKGNNPPSNRYKKFYDN